jgi:FixJ family two-component response regulator
MAPITVIVTLFLADSEVSCGFMTKPIKIKEFMEAVNMALEFAEKRLVSKPDYLPNC